MLLFFFFFFFFPHRKCGQRPPSNPLEVTSSGNIMLINFITDTDAGKPGFLAQYKAIPKSSGNKVEIPIA